MAVVDTFPEFLQHLDLKKMVKAPFCGGKDCEDKIKKDSARFVNFLVVFNFKN